MLIRIAENSDIDSIHRLERSLEKCNAATRKTLTERLLMFPDGFYVAEEGGKICGYIESCLWNNVSFVKFEEIKDFPKFHDPDGRILYIIFLAVDEKYQRLGVGSKLVRTLQKYASKKGLKKVQVVSAEGFWVNFYKKLGFQETKRLPYFLPNIFGILMEYQIKNE
ncbi:MAG: GNAT family N-acetyltransferase [Candidatus Bathyarchaeota archaeon]|nr:GNAT family N-acetyltransferase [Candidatus Bathyarchaeota archaeon]